MKEPNHKGKRRREDFINDDKIHSLYVDDNSDTVIYDHFGWLGSGLFDKNGVEIFEGDIVNCGCEGVMTVVFSNGVFCIENQIETYELPDCNTSTLEIIGHIAEGTNHAEI